METPSSPESAVRYASPLLMDLSEPAGYKTEKICFEQTSFNYLVEYIEQDGVTKITCSHNEEYYCWSKTISEPILTEKHSTDRSSFVLELTPKLLFTILKEFRDNKLDNTFELKFPKKYKTVTTDLFIEINTRLPYSDDVDIKFIYLEPGSITEAERFDFKLDRMKRTIEKENSSAIAELQSEIAKLQNVLSDIGKLYSEIKKINNKTALIDDEMDRFVNADDINNALRRDLVEYATKDELGKVSTEIQDIKNNITIIKKDVDVCALETDLQEYATKAELAIYATNQDLAQYATTENLAQYAPVAYLAQYATKQDLAPYATTASLAQYAPVENLAQYATKADLTLYAPKTV